MTPCGLAFKVNAMLLLQLCVVTRRYDCNLITTLADHPLADLLYLNIYRERITETVTDSLRALLLELANYNVQVFEFIGEEHTGMNVMIAAVIRH
jgi:hypothetical protein